MTYKSPLISFSHELIFRDLAAAIKRDVRRAQLSLTGAFLFVKKGSDEPPDNGGQAQSARCIYCSKAIRSWGTAPKGKKQSRNLKTYEILSELQEMHSYACAESWAWCLFARHALGDTTVYEEEKIKAWLDKLFNEIGELKRRGYTRQNEGRLRTLFEIVEMFERLPTRARKVIDAIEFFVMGCGDEARKNTWPEQVIPHGLNERNPHVFLPCVFGDARHGLWGQCPCGEIEWRGPDRQPHEKLIGWGKKNRKHTVMRLVDVIEPNTEPIAMRSWDDAKDVR